MPDIASKIPLGFNLDGYDFLRSANTTPSLYGVSGGVGGVNAAWGGGLDNNRWVADQTLKQVQFEGTTFQAVPLIRVNDEGEKFLCLMTDETGEVDGQGLSGGSAWAGSIFANCSLSDTEKLNKWSQQNKAYHEGQCDDFSCGVAVCWVTVRDYLNHFYNLNVTDSQAKRLCGSHCLCVEVLYNTTATEGKAFRMKVVDSSGDRGYQGSENFYGKWTYTYDVLDTMIAPLLTSDFRDIVVYGNSEFGSINSDKLYFPWKTQKYNYKKAQIPGYSPTQLLSLGIKDSDQTVGATSGLQIKSHYLAKGVSRKGTKYAHAISRGRFFADPEHKDKVQQIIPNIPDEFFKTNYADGSTNTFIYSLSSASGIAGKIESMAISLAAVVRSAFDAKDPFYYDNGEFVAAPSGSPFKYQSKNRCIDCDSYVDWILTEVGVKKGPVGTLSCVKARDWSAESINKYIEPGLKAVDLGRDISQAQVGDILIWGNSESHAAIYKGMENGAIVEYGMGGWSKVGRTKPNPHEIIPETSFVGQPHRGMGTTNLTHIIRITQA